MERGVGRHDRELVFEYAVADVLVTSTPTSTIIKFRQKKSVTVDWEILK